MFEEGECIQFDYKSGETVGGSDGLGEPGRAKNFTLIRTLRVDEWCPGRLFRTGFISFILEKWRFDRRRDWDSAC